MKNVLEEKYIKHKYTQIHTHKHTYTHIVKKDKKSEEEGERQILDVNLRKNINITK